MTSFGKVANALKDLPVAPIADEVVQSVMKGQVTVLAAPTGSGKSMLVPAMLAAALDKTDSSGTEPLNQSDAQKKQVLVLVPRRFLATDAAMNVAHMSGTKLGTDVGYAIGEIGGERSLKSPNTKLLFATYGYAISSGLIDTAQTIVLDEVHEASEDISLARAILLKRKQSKKPEDVNLRLLEMSATVNIDKQASYWKDVATIAKFDVDGSQLKYDERHESPEKSKRSITDIALHLLQNENPPRKGIAIFRSGIREVEQTVEDLKTALNNDPNIEVVGIHGGTPKDERDKARAAPETGKCKIIVGTNVIESGVNLLWVDSGISDGFGKIPYDRPDTGAYALVQENLAAWRVIQQRGRINRAPTDEFPSGIFILHAKDGMDKRVQPQKPELARRSVRNVAFRAACLGYKPDQLTFDTRITPDRWQEAKEELIRLGLIQDNWTLTDDGTYVKSLPVSPEAGAMLCEANRIDEAAGKQKSHKLLGDAIIMAALMEQGGIREEPDMGHKLDGRSDVHGGSDIIDGLKAYRHLEKNPNATIVAQAAIQTDTLDDAQQATIDAARKALKDACVGAKLNVNYTDFCATMLLVNEIRDRVKLTEKNPIENHTKPDAAHYNGLKRCVLNGNANRLFQLESAGGHTYRDLLRDYGKHRNNNGAPFNGYLINSDSVECRTPKETPDPSQRIKVRGQEPLLVGRLREKPSKGGGDGVAFIDQVTSIPAQVFLDWAATRDQDAAEPQKLLQNATRDKDGGSLSGCYAGKASFEIPLERAKANGR